MPKQKVGNWGEIEKFNLLVCNYEREFLVFIDDDLNVGYQVDDRYYRNHRNEYRDALKAINDVTSVGAMPCGNLDKKDVLRFKIIIGEGITMALLFDLDRARVMMDMARKFNETRNIEVSRYWQLLYSLVAIGSIGLAGVAAWSARLHIKEALGNGFMLLLLAFIAGTVGAFLSIASRMTTLVADKSGASMKLHISETVTRILTGGISGVFAVTVVKSGLVLGNLTSNCGDIWNVLLVSVAAGLSERFVPSIASTMGLTRTDAASGSGSTPPSAPVGPAKQGRPAQQKPPEESPPAQSAGQPGDQTKQPGQPGGQADHPDAASGSGSTPPTAPDGPAEQERPAQQESSEVSPPAQSDGQQEMPGFGPAGARSPGGSGGLTRRLLMRLRPY